MCGRGARRRPRMLKDQSREFIAFLHSPVQWVFNRSLLWDDGEDGQHLGVSLSAATREVAMSREEPALTV